jgi:hypothetical protein
MSLSQNIEDKLSDLVDDPSFQRIDESFKCFNIFEAVGAVRAELRHSNFLAFLLSPSRPHGLGAEILARLLKAFLAKIPHAQRPISILKLLVGDLDTAVVERERNNIDILIEISAIKLIIVIENKVGAAVADGQLARYKQFVKSKFSGWNQLFVLLTVDGNEPDDDTYDADYICFSYVDLAGILARYLRERRNSISDDIALILRSYVDTMRRFIVEER